MSTLTFMPWKTLSEPLKFGRFSLLPYKLGTNPDYDQVLSNFHNSGDKTIESATILYFDGSDPTANLNEEKVGELLEFGEMLALSILSNRRLFSQFDYTNSHSLKSIAQRFKSGSPGVAVNARRRDGETLIGLSGNRAVTKAAYHVQIEDSLEIDTDFCEALVNYSSFEDRPILEFIFLFLQANTDSPDVTSHSELVLVCGAIESVLGIKNGSTGDLVKAFCTEMRNALLLDSDLVRTEKFDAVSKSKTHQKAADIREAWIKDFYITRGDIAHGRKHPQYESQWSIQEHMILASEIYPILVKLKLRTAGVYDLKESDYEKMFYFDHRISMATIMKIGEEHHMPVFGWDKAVKDAKWDWAFKKDKLIVHSGT
jgi:hypothetical protein